MKTSNQLTQVLLLSGTLLLASCGVTLYVPNTVNTPLLHEKEDFKINAGFVGYAPETTFDVQGAYAVSDHAVVLANTSFMSGNTGNDNFSNNNTHTFLEGGGGLYTSFWPNKNGWNIGRAEALGGYGFGWAEDFDNGQRFTGRYQRLFVQPAFGIRHRVVDATLGMRFGFVSFSDYRRYEGNTLMETDQLGFSTVEPVLTIALGYKYVKYYMQFGGLNLLSGQEDYRRVTQDDLFEEGIFNVGLTFSPWKEESSPPPVAFEPPRAKDRPTQPESREDAPQPLPASAIIAVDAADLSICVQEGGTPDGDVVAVSFNGVYIFRELELSKKADCFDVSMMPGQEAVLRIQALTDGQFKPNTVRVSVEQGGKTQTFYLQPALGEVAEVRLSAK